MGVIVVAMRVVVGLTLVTGWVIAALSARLPRDERRDFRSGLRYGRTS